MEYILSITKKYDDSNYENLTQEGAKNIFINDIANGNFRIVEDEKHPNQQCFLARLQEVNGEQEYYHDIVIKASNLEEAEKNADDYASKFYDDSGEKTEDGYEFFGGRIAVYVESVQNMSRRDIKKRLFEEALI